jgi:hypothetical protein
LELHPREHRHCIERNVLLLLMLMMMVVMMATITN